MIGEISTSSHLFDAKSMDQGDTTETTGENGVTSASSNRDAMYFEVLVVVIGAIGTAANGLVLYALVASKQHKKHELIVNQNAIDLYCCLFLVIIYSLRASNMYLSGSLGYWLCMFIHNGFFIFVGFFASTVNLMFISVERYLKVVHSTWSKTHLRKWMSHTAIACMWVGGVIHQMPLGFQSSAVIDGVCYGFVILSPQSLLALGIYYFVFTYLFVLAVFIFCYGKILMAVRRQARIMAGHNDRGPSNAQAHLNRRIQSSVIKTMILVCIFYAVAWMPEKIVVLLIGLHANLNFQSNAYYATVFFGFLYICTNFMIITNEQCLNVVNRLRLSG